MAKEKRTFHYQRRTREQMEKRAAGGGDFDSIIKAQYKIYKVKEGKNLVRILPPTWDKPDHYGYNLWVNYGIGVDNQSYLSLSKMLKERDPLAEARNAADREGDEELAKALAPKKRVAMWVIDRLNEEEGPQIWLCPITVDKDIAAIAVDDETGEIIPLDDPKEGSDLRFFREGKGRNTKYPAAKMRLLKPSPISAERDLWLEWREYIMDHPLPECLQYYDYKHIAEAFDGNVRTDDDDEKAARRKAVDPDDDDDAPSRGRRSTQRSREADPDDDDDTPPWKGRGNGKSDEDEEPPRKAAKPSRKADPDDGGGEEADDPPPREQRRAASGRSRTVPRDAPEDDGDEDAPPPRRAAKRPPVDEADDDDNEPEADPPPRGSIRDRIARNRAASPKRGDD